MGSGLRGGDLTRQVSKEDIGLPVEGDGLELASLARHAVDVCLSEGSLFPIPLRFCSVITTIRPC